MSLVRVPNRNHFEPCFPLAILQQIPDLQDLANRVNEVYYKNKNKQDPKLINTIIDMGADYLDSHPELYDKLKKIQTSIGVYLSRICIRASLKQLSKEKSAELEKENHKANEGNSIVSSARQTRNNLQISLITFKNITTAFSNLFFRVKTNVPRLEEQSKKLQDRVDQMKSSVANLKNYSVSRFVLQNPKTMLGYIALNGIDIYLKWPVHHLSDCCFGLPFQWLLLRFYYFKVYDRNTNQIPNKIPSQINNFFFGYLKKNSFIGFALNHKDLILSMFGLIGAGYCNGKKHFTSGICFLQIPVFFLIKEEYNKRNQNSNIQHPQVIDHVDK